MKVLEEMHNNKRYKQMVIYMEACESGSMFDKIPTDWNSKIYYIYTSCMYPHRKLL